MEDSSVFQTDGENHLWLKSRLEEEATSRHRAASARERKTRKDLTIITRLTQEIPTGMDLLLVLAEKSLFTSHSLPPAIKSNMNLTQTKCKHISVFSISY